MAEEGVHVSSEKKSNPPKKQTHGVRQLTVQTVIAQIQTSASFVFHPTQKGRLFRRTCIYSKTLLKHAHFPRFRRIVVENMFNL